MAAIITREVGATAKGSPLSNAELDQNFINLNQATQPAGGTTGQILAKVSATNYDSQWIDNYATQVKLLVKNNTGSTIPKGSVVYISGAQGANALVSLALATSDSTSATTVGILESQLTNGAIGLVVVTGVVSGLNTSAAQEGDSVWLSGTVPGGMVYGNANKPQAPVHIVYLGTVTRAHATQGEIQVHISNGWELGELHDVQINSPTSTHLLAYDSVTGLWKNRSLVSGDIPNLDASKITSGTLDSARLPSSGVTAGTYGSDVNIPQIVVDSTGRLTSVTNVGVTIPSGSLTFTGDVTGSGNTGSTTTLTLSNSGITAGTYTKVTVDSKGRATSGTTLVASDIPSLDASKITSGTIAIERLPQDLGGGKITVSTTPPTGAQPPDEWIDSNTGIKYTYIDDGTSFQWVELEATVTVAEVTGTTSAPSIYSNEYVVSGTTTNATETEIFVDGIANSRISVPLNKTIYYTADIVCRRTDAAGDHAAFYVKGVATNNGGTVSDVGLIYEVNVARTDAVFAVDLRADDTTDSINVYVTGNTGKTLSWKCAITVLEV